MPDQTLNIAIADDDRVMQEFYKRALADLGHRVMSVAATGAELVEKCRQERPDLIITDIKMPDMDGIDAAAQIYDEQPVPVILVTAHVDPEYIERADSKHIMSYLVKPVEKTDLEPAIAVVRGRFQQFQQLQGEADNLKQALEDRKLIERAKGILMQRTGLSEPDAFRRLQKTASSKSVKLVEIARTIITADETMNLG